MFRDTYESYLQKQASWGGIARKLASLAQGLGAKLQARQTAKLMKLMPKGQNVVYNLDQISALKPVSLTQSIPGYARSVGAPTLQNTGASYLGPEQQAQLRALLSKSKRSPEANQWLRDLQAWNMGNGAMFNSNPPRIPKRVLDEITLKDIL